MSAIALFTDHHRYYLYTGYTDMRKSFSGLCGVISNIMQMNIADKHVYIFLNKQQTHIKVLLHEAGGFTMLYRKLDKGRFSLPVTDIRDGSLLLSASDLLSIIKGLSLHRYKHGSTNNDVKK